MADTQAPQATSNSNNDDASASTASESVSNGFNILVKNPTDRPGSSPFVVTVAPDSTVLQLKQMLQESYPGSPTVRDQRLIYAGKLLGDSDVMETLIGSADRTAQHTVHLVVSNRNAPPPAPSNPTSTPSNSTQGNAAPNAAPQVDGVPGFPLLGANNMFPTYYASLPNPYMYQGMQHPMPPNGPQQYQMPFAVAFPTPPPPSDNAAAPQNLPGGMPPPFGVPPAAYATHLQAMERAIADTLQAQQNAAQAANNVPGTAREAAQAGEAHAQAAQQAAQQAQQAQQVAAEAAAAVAAMHAQAHAQAMANYNAGVGANGGAPPMGVQMGNNAQAQAQQPPRQGHARPEGFGFAIGRNVGPNGMQNPLQNGNQEMGEGGPRVRQFVFQFEINWALISKLIFLVYLLGQEGSTMRVYSLMLIAGIIYLWQTNRLGFVRRLAGAAVPNPGQLVEALFPQQNPTEGNDPSNANENDGNEESRARPRQPHRFGRAAVVASYAYSFLYGFICSLLPAWQPERLPRMDELLNLNQDEANPPQPADNRDDANHEHAD